jgi:hypothetical protein
MNKIKIIKCVNENYTSTKIINDLKKNKDKIYFINNDQNFHENFKHTIFSIDSLHNDDVCRTLFNYSMYIYHILNLYIKNNFSLNNISNVNDNIDPSTYNIIYNDNDLKYFNKKIKFDKYIGKYTGMNDNIDEQDKFIKPIKNNDKMPNAEIELNKKKIYTERILFNLINIMYYNFIPLFECPITVYRGSKYIDIKNNILITDQFYSVSYFKNIALGFASNCLLKIHLPSKTPLLSLTSCSALDDDYKEYELIINYKSKLKLIHTDTKYKLYMNDDNFSLTYNELEKIFGSNVIKWYDKLLNKNNKIIKKDDKIYKFIKETYKDINNVYLQSESGNYYVKPFYEYTFVYL